MTRRRGSDRGGGRDRPTMRGLAASVAGAVRSRPPGELALVAVPLPALLLAVWLLPGSDAWRFSLAAAGVLESRTTLWTAFASSFVHADATHLVDNVVNYWLLVAVAYPLSVIAGWRRRLLYATLTYLAVVPLVSAWATLAAIGGATNAPAAGFSDVNNALLGYLVVVWFAALASERAVGNAGSAPAGRAEDAEPVADPRGAGVDARWSIVAVCGSLAVVFAVPGGVDYFPARPAVGASFAVATAVAAAGLYASVGRPRIAGLNLSPSRELLYVAGASVAVAGVIGSLVVVPLGSNVFAHLAGYAIGVTVPFLGVIADGRRVG